MLEEDQTNSPLGQITEGCCKKAIHYVKYLPAKKEMFPEVVLTIVQPVRISEPVRISKPVNRLITENITTALVNAGHITHPAIA